MIHRAKFQNFKALKDVGVTSNIPFLARYVSPNVLTTRFGNYQLRVGAALLSFFDGTPITPQQITPEALNVARTQKLPFFGSTEEGYPKTAPGGLGPAQRRPVTEFGEIAHADTDGKLRGRASLYYVYSAQTRTVNDG